MLKKRQMLGIIEDSKKFMSYRIYKVLLVYATKYIT